MQRFSYTTLLSALLLSFFLIPSALFAVSFTRTLTVGDSGEDVRELQKLLNRNVQTRVSAIGDGSLGNETTYFGTLTASAVSRYQALYASEILTPLGLSTGTGLAGSRTLAHLTGGVGIVSTTPTSATGVTEIRNVSGSKFDGGTSGSGSSEVRIASISPSRGGVGTVVTVKGYGFSTTGNKVGSAFEEFTNVPSADGMTMRVTIQGPFPKDFLEENKDFYEHEKFEMEYQFGVTSESGARSNFMPFTFLFY